MIDDGKPIFVQIAEQIENDIIDGVIAEESPVPSTNEFAAFYRINPATAGRGVNRLVDDGILYKKRGIGMFVATGARDRLLARRSDEFRTNYVRPLLIEAAKLDISPAQLVAMIQADAAAAPFPPTEPGTPERSIPEHNIPEHNGTPENNGTSTKATVTS